MFQIIQSNSPDILVDNLLDFYQNTTNQSLSLSDLVFSKFTVIVPSMVLGEWLNKQVATKLGISTLFTAQFWGKYQWDMIKNVLEADGAAQDGLKVPEVAVLSASIIRWRIFGFLNQQIQIHTLEAIIDEENSPLSFLLSPLYDKQENDIPQNRIWQACDELAKIYVRYLTHRPKWLLAWAKGKSLKNEVQKMMMDKIKMHSEFNAIIPDVAIDKNQNTTLDDQIPDWLQEYYLNLEKLLGYLWHTLFAKTYLYREKLEQRFWQIVEEKELDLFAKNALPKRLYLFTLQQIPQVELDFLKRLSLSLDVVLFHFNPSMLFWADIVDKNWLLTQQIIKPQSVYLKDYGHGLLSRLGKESRETFAMLADMSGGADENKQAWQIIWQDKFVQYQKDTLLDRLKQDILMLGDTQMDAQTALGVDLLQIFENLTKKDRPKVSLPLDKIDSLSIHACHSLKRQLEIARLMIAKYLNENSNKTLADVVVLLPDVTTTEELIRSVFPEGVGADGLTLPIKITGTTDKEIDELLFAISGFYTLVGDLSSRFYAKEVYEWLMTPALYKSFDLTFSEIKRGCELLTQAGFKRGFDEMHLKQTLVDGDVDFRYSFSYALDRIVLGLFVAIDKPSTAIHPFKWQKDVLCEAVLPLQTVSLSDQKIVYALAEIHQGLAKNRRCYTKVDRVEVILNKIEQDVINKYFAKFNQTDAMNAIFATKNSMMSDLRANANYQQYHKEVKNKHHQEDIRLTWQFALNSLTHMVQAQAIKAEPADVITFARFGALRSIPFGLTVMLDMNLSAFPRQDRAVRLDLMRAGIKKRGDRYNEDDDNGAFLDALLCTKDKLLIFYNGMSADGQTSLLPASVVSELIQFLKTEAHWTIALDKNEDFNNHQTEQIHQAVNEMLPSLIEDYLITYHSATAFDRSVFYQKQSSPVQSKTNDLKQQIKSYLQQKLTDLKYYQQCQLPPAQLWQSVRLILDKQDLSIDKALVKLPDQQFLNNLQVNLQKTIDYAQKWIDLGQYESEFFDHCLSFLNLFNIILETSYEINKITNCITRPNHHYLTDKIHLIKENTEESDNEPLLLSNLDSFKLKKLLLDNSLLINHKDNKPLKNENLFNQSVSIYYDNMLPVGITRLTKVEEVINNIDLNNKEFYNIIIKYLKDNNIYESTIILNDLITQIDQQNIELNFGKNKIILTEKLPDKEKNLWINLLPNSSRLSHLFNFWINHLLWQIARKTNNQDIDNNHGSSIWYFDKPSDEIKLYKEKKVFTIKPIHYKIATAYLFNLMIIDKVGKKTPLIFTMRESINYLFSENKEEFIRDKNNFKKWVNQESYTYSAFMDKQSSVHDLWKIIINNHDSLSLLINNLDLTEPIFKIMIDNIKPITF